MTSSFVLSSSSQRLRRRFLAGALVLIVCWPGAFPVLPSASAQEAAPAGTPAPALADRVVVTAQLVRGQEEAVDTERAAPNVENIQSAEQIARYPDVALGEAASRLPGVGLQTDTGAGRFLTIRGLDSNLNGTTFGGVRVPSTDGQGRHVAFDQFPAGLVSRVVVTKSNVPDMDAEALGGTIELTPRSAFDSDRPILQGRLGSGFEPLRPKYPIYDGEITLGTTFGLGANGRPAVGGKDGRGGSSKEGVDAKDAGSGAGLAARPFGLLGTASYFEDHRGIDDFEPSYADQQGIGGSDKALSSVDLRHYIYNRKTYGVGGTFDFRPDANNAFYLGYVQGGYSEQVYRRIRSYQGLDGSNTDADGNPDGASLGGGTGFEPPRDANNPRFYAVGHASIRESLRNNVEHFDNRVLQGGGFNQLGPLTIDYKGSFAQAYRSNPRDFNLNFTTPGIFRLRYDNQGYSNQPKFQVSGANQNDNTLYRFSSLTIDENYQVDTEVAGAANFTLPFQTFGYASTAKFGANLRFRDKTAHDNPRNFRSYADPAAGDGSFTLANVASTEFLTIYGDRYQVGNGPDRGKSDRFFSRNGANFVQSSQSDRVRSLQAFQNDTENIFAGYGEYLLDAKQFHLLAGVRVESTQARYGAYQNPVGTDPGDPNSYAFANRRVGYTQAFPTVQLRYEVTKNFQARFAYSTEIGRPSFNQVSATTVVDSGNFTITAGNPSLKPTTANSFDLTFEYFPSKGAILQLGLFDKEFSDYVFQRSIIVPFEGRPYTSTTFLNAGSARARGIELNYEQQFDFLPGPLAGLGVAANYTYVDSSGEARPGERVRLPFTTPNLFNVTLFYRRYGVDFSLSGQYNDRFVTAFGNSYLTDQYIDSRFVVDLSLNYQFTKGVSAFFYAQNITDAPLRLYEGRPERPIQREFYNPTFRGGLKFNL